MVVTDFFMHVAPRFVAYKVAALEGVISRFGAYSQHFTNSSDDLPTVKMVSSRIVDGVDGSTNYQETSLTRYEEGMSYFRIHKG